MKPKQSFRETGQKQQHTRVCVPDATAQMIGNANNDSCRTAAIVPYKERLGEFNNCSRLHLENLVPCTSSYFVHIPVFHREDEAANFSAHPSSLRYSPPLKSNLKHESDTMMFDLTFEIVHSKINNRLLIANISDGRISAYVCQTASHHSSGLHKHRLEMNSERNRFDANSNTANAIYRNSKYEQCQGGKGGVFSPNTWR